MGIFCVVLFQRYFSPYLFWMAGLFFVPQSDSSFGQLWFCWMRFDLTTALLLRPIAADLKPATETKDLEWMWNQARGPHPSLIETLSPVKWWFPQCLAVREHGHSALGPCHLHWKPTEIKALSMLHSSIRQNAAFSHFFAGDVKKEATPNQNMQHSSFSHSWGPEVSQQQAKSLF